MTKLLKLYPKSWRDRYGEEFEALLEEHTLSFADRVNLTLCGLSAWVRVAIRRLGLVTTGRHSGSDRAGYSLLLAGILWLSVVPWLRQTDAWSHLRWAHFITLALAGLFLSLVVRGCSSLVQILRDSGRSTKSITSSYRRLVLASALTICVFASQVFWLAASSPYALLLGMHGALLLLVFSWSSVGLQALHANVLSRWSALPVLLVFPLYAVTLSANIGFVRYPTFITTWVVALNWLLFLTVGVSWVLVGLVVMTTRGVEGSARAHLNE